MGINNHRHFFLYLISLTFGILAFDWVFYYYISIGLETTPSTDDTKCLILADHLCRAINYDPFTVLLAIWTTLQLTWVGMLLFVQFIQVARAMTTYENMYGIQDGSASSIVSAFTSTGAPLDPSHPDAATPPSAADDPLGARGGGAHAHGHRGFLRQWARLLGVDTFIETATGRGAATAGGSRHARRKRGNPYSRGYLQNCRDFWCDPAPVFGRRETGDAMLDGQKINYTDIYESPAAMDITLGPGGRRRGGYEAVPGGAV